MNQQFATTESSLSTWYSSRTAAAVLRLTTLSLSLSCTQEIILPLCSPAPQIYYSSSSPSSQQDRNSAAEGKDEGGQRGRCLPSLFICCKDAAVSLHHSLLLEQHTEWEISTEWGSALRTGWHQMHPFINLMTGCISHGRGKTQKKREPSCETSSTVMEVLWLSWFLFQASSSISLLGIFSRWYRHWTILQYQCWASCSRCSYRQWFSFASACNEREPLRFNGDTCFLYVLFSIPKMKATGIKIYSKCTGSKATEGTQLRTIYVFIYSIFIINKLVLFVRK